MIGLPPNTSRRCFFGRGVLLDLPSASRVRWLREKRKGRSEKRKGKASAARLSDRRQREKENRRRLPRAISAAIREDSGTKTEVSHDEGPVSAFLRGLIFRPRKNSQVRESPNSRAPRGPRLPPWDTSVFVPRFALRVVLFRAAVHCIRSASRLAQELNAVPAMSGVRPIAGGPHSQRRSRTLGGRSKCVQGAILAGFPHRAENRTRT